MSKKKKKGDAPAPRGSAGLLSFYTEKTDSVFKISPEVVIIVTIGLILGVLLGSIFIPR